MTFEQKSPTQPSRFCGHCGAPTQGTAFCENCGAELPKVSETTAKNEITPIGMAHPGTVAETPTLAVERSPTPPGGVPVVTIDSTYHPSHPASQRLGWIIGGVIAALVLIGGAVGAVFAFARGTPEQGPSYTTLAVRSVTPVLTANDKLTQDIAALSPSGTTNTVQSDVSSAQSATQTAQQQLSSTRSDPTLSALTGQLDAALSSEMAWLQAVSTVLSNTQSPVLSQLSGLGEDAQSKFHQLGSRLPVLAASPFPSSSKLVTYISAKNNSALANLSNAGFSNQVLALLNQSTSSYQTINSLFGQLNAIANGGSTDLTIATTQQQLNSVIANRQSLSAAAQALDPPTPAAQKVQAELVAAFNTSLRDDNDIATCFNEQNFGTFAYISQTCLNSTSGDASAATSAKQTFLSDYNQLRATVGMAPVNIQF